VGLLPDVTKQTTASDATADALSGSSADYASVLSCGMKFRK
jgi:hypothetical protein